MVQILIRQKDPGHFAKRQIALLNLTLSVLAHASIVQRVECHHSHYNIASCT